jgi:hypothetical protein
MPLHSTHSCRTSTAATSLHRGTSSQPHPLLLPQVLRFQQWQAAQKQKQRTAAAAGGLEEAVMLQLSVEEQEERFREYADQCLAGYKAGGRPSKAIELYVTKKREDPLLQV